MGARDFSDDVGTLFLLFALAKLGGWRWDGRDWLKQAPKGGRGAGRGSTTVPVPQGGAQLWSENTMRMFVEQMNGAGITPHVVLLGIAAASRFNADEVLGNNVGLLLVSRDDLREVGYPGDVPFEQRDAIYQIPWIAKVIAYRLANTGGGEPPDNVGDLAVLLHPSNPTLAPYIRNEANKRAAEADGTMLYASHEELLKHVLSNP